MSHRKVHQKLIAFYYLQINLKIVSKLFDDEIDKKKREDTFSTFFLFWKNANPAFSILSFYQFCRLVYDPFTEILKLPFIV